MTRWSLAAALAFCAGAVAPVASPAIVCAGEGARAALVIDTGAAVTTYCVALPDGSASGLELIALAGEQHGLDYSLGFGGEAVCRLEGVGPEGDDCFGEYPEFWGYWHGDGSGGWNWAGTGAGGATIEDGDIDGWSWGSGDNGSNHQAPPETEHDDVCPPEAEPAPAAPQRPSKGGRRGDGRSAAPTPTVARDAVAEPAPGEPGSGRDPKKRERVRPRRHENEHEDPAAPVVTPAPEATEVAAAPASDESGEGPPLTGLVGLAAAGALGVAAWRGSRRKKA